MANDGFQRTDGKRILDRKLLRKKGKLDGKKLKMMQMTDKCFSDNKSTWSFSEHFITSFQCSH